MQNTSAEAEVFFFCPPLADGQKRRAKGKRSHACVVFCIESPKRSRQEAPLAEHYYKAPADETSDANDSTPACRRAKAAGKIPRGFCGDAVVIRLKRMRSLGAFRNGAQKIRKRRADGR